MGIMEEGIKRTVGSNGLLSDRTVKIMLGVTSLTMVAIHLLYTQIFFLSREVYLTCHMSFSFAIIFMLTIQKTKSKIHTIILLASVVLCAVFTVYIAMNVEMLRVRSWSSTDMDLIIGVIMLALAFYAAYLGYGWFIPVLVLLVIIYPSFGRNMPQPFTTTAYPWKITIANLSIGLKTGLYDPTIAISADFVFLFSVFGGLLGATGVQSFFYEFGKLLVGRFRSGSAQITILNTALVGSVVGSGIANVSITGPYCLDSMKKSGYTGVQAAAILSAGANGGQILPPVMGIIAFAMAGFSGVPYFEICKMALIPAIMYYSGLALYCHLNALKHPEMKKKRLTRPDVDMDIIKYRGLSFIVPFAMIIFLFARGYSVMNVAFRVIVTVIVMSFLTPKSYRPKFRDLIRGFIDGGISGAQVGCVCAVIGLLVATFTSSGLGIKLTSGIDTWSGGSLFVALMILYVVSIIAGMAGVSVAAYFTAAAFAVPVLVKMGVPFALAHFFIVYPAAFSTITPPVALVSLVASRQAGSPYGLTAIESCKVAATGFLMPFMLIYAPAVTMATSFASLWTWLDIILLGLMFTYLQFIWCNYMLTPTNILEKLLLITSSITLLLFFGRRNHILLLIGVGALIAVTATQIIKLYRKRKMEREPA